MIMTRCACGNDLGRGARFCGHCGISVGVPNTAPLFEYTVIRADSHKSLIRFLNDHARMGWEPMTHTTWSRDVTNADHFVMARRLLPPPV